MFKDRRLPLNAGISVVAGSAWSLGPRCGLASCGAPRWSHSRWSPSGSHRANAAVCWSDGARLDRRDHQSAALRRDCERWRLSYVVSVVGGTTEIIKEIIGRSLDL